MVHAPDRDAAIDALRRALDETEIGGIQTSLPFHHFVARSDAFRRGDVSTAWVDANWDGEAARRDAVRHALVAAGLAAFEDPSGASMASPPPVATTSDPAAAPVGGWRAEGRERGIDRWPG
jgi:acetyl/propionyl-CoA carboxylase alpha subunit